MDLIQIQVHVSTLNFCLRSEDFFAPEQTSHDRSVVAMTPFLCYSHPNGEQSLLKYPESLCNENGAMQTTGLFFVCAGDRREFSGDYVG